MKKLAVLDVGGSAIKYCTMCGPHFCAMRISQQLRDCDYTAGGEDDGISGQQ